MTISPRHRSLPPVVVALAIAAACLGANSLHAREGRTLGGFRFVPSSRVEDPFVTTHFRNATGMAFASNVNVPILVIEDTPPDTLLSLEGNVLFIVADFQYQHEVHSRVAVRLEGNGASRVGTSGQALLSQGVTALLSGGLGATVELWRNERVLLSGAADLGYGQSLRIDFVQFAGDIIAGERENASLLTKDRGPSIDTSLRVAWAARHWIGVTGLGQLGFSGLGSRSDLLWRIAGTGSLDFGQDGKAPVGLQLVVDIDRLKAQPAEVRTAFFLGLGVYYTGRDDLNIGVEGTWGRLPLQDRDVTVHPTTTVLALRYYF